MEHMDAFPLLAFVYVPLHRNLDAIAHAPNVDLENLHRTLNIYFVQLIRPPIDVIHIPELTRDANASTEPDTHTSVCEPL
jgi:hypothetical protein